MAKRLRLLGAWCLVASGTGVATFMLLDPVPATAAWLKVHASSCQLVSGTVVTTDEGIRGLDTTDNKVWANCSYPESSAVTKSSIAEVFVTGARVDNPFSFDDKASAKVCRSFSTSNSGECGAASSTTSVGNIDLQVTDLSAWNNSSGFGYVHAEFSGWGQDIRGLYFGQ
jgi:hypothetical protein